MVGQTWSKSVVLAQTEKYNPLELSTPDPLLPNLSLKQPLTPLEISTIKQTIEELNTQANTLLAAGNDQEAFALWYRELRLQRVLGKLAEVKALKRVGGIAWDKSRQADVQIINNRLKIIQQEASLRKELTLELVSGLGQAYQQVRNVNNALEMYQNVLSNARQERSIQAIKTTLVTIGELYLAKFDYAQAGVIYEELLTIAQQEQDYFNEGIYLSKLGEIYTQGGQPENGLRIKQQQVDNYLKNQQVQRLPALYISIAADYQALNQPEVASQNYQQAFSIAWSLQQLGAASEALQKLGSLYQSHGESTSALQIYQELLKVEQQSYSFYGLMNTYDRIGKIYLEQKNYTQALAAFEQGKAIATSLKYQQDYFTNQIQQVNQLMIKSN